MQSCVLATIVVLLVALLVQADDPDATVENDNEIEVGETPQPGNPQDVFERGVMDRLPAKVQSRMQKFFRQDASSVTDVQMKNLFESTFTPEEQKQIGTIFTEVLSEQVESIMGKMDGLNDQMDDMTGTNPKLDNWDDTEEDHGHLYDEELNTIVNDSVALNDKKKFVLETTEDPEHQQEEGTSDTAVGEDDITNSPSAKDEF